MFAVGEFWKDSITDLEVYLDGLGTQFSVFDAPLHYNFKEAGDRGSEYDLRAIWDGTVVQKRPIDAVTLVENHECVSLPFRALFHDTERVLFQYCKCLEPFIFAVDADPNMQTASRPVPRIGGEPHFQAPRIRPHSPPALGISVRSLQLHFFLRELNT